MKLGFEMKDGVVTLTGASKVKLPDPPAFTSTFWVNNKLQLTGANPAQMRIPFAQGHMVTTVQMVGE